MTDDQLREAAREFGRRNAARRRIVERTCEVCGQPTSGTLKRRYCSNACRNRASRQRRAATDSSDAFAAMQPGSQQPGEDSSAWR